MNLKKVFWKIFVCLLYLSLYIRGQFQLPNHCSNFDESRIENVLGQNIRSIYILRHFENQNLFWPHKTQVLNLLYKKSNSSDDQYTVSPWGPLYFRVKGIPHKRALYNIRRSLLRILKDKTQENVFFCDFYKQKIIKGHLATRMQFKLKKGVLDRIRD